MSVWQDLSNGAQICSSSFGGDCEPSQPRQLAKAPPPAKQVKPRLTTTSRKQNNHEVKINGNLLW